MFSTIKYYDYHPHDRLKDSTPYNGYRGFTYARSSSNTAAESESTRRYPNEYLICEILQSYVTKRNPQFPVTITIEDWCKNGGKRDGSVNVNIYANILLNVDKPEYQDGLILAPLVDDQKLLGIAVDLKNKHALYVDADGAPPCPLAQELWTELRRKGFTVDHVSVRQHNNFFARDLANAGPIITASLMKFFEEFFACGRISPAGFEAPMTRIATHRMLQIYFNNLDFTNKELMLADVNLWRCFLAEQSFQTAEESHQFFAQLEHLVRLQKSYLEKFANDQNYERYCRYASAFQSKFIELLILRSPDYISEFNKLFQQLLLIFENPEALTESIPLPVLEDLFNYPQNLCRLLGMSTEELSSASKPKENVKRPVTRAPDTFSNFLNPFREVFETRKFLLAHARRTTLAEKLAATFYVFFGSFFDKEKSNHVGMFDWFTLGIPGLFTFLPVAVFGKTSGAAQLLVIPAAILALPFVIARIAFAMAMTLIFSIPVAMVHGCSEFLAGGNGFKREIKDIQIELNPNAKGRFERSVKSAQEDLAGNLNRYNVDVRGTYAQVTVDFHRQATGPTSSLGCDCCLNGEKNHVVFAATFDLANNTQHRRQFTHLLRGNVGGIVNELDNAGVDAEQFAKADSLQDTSEFTTYPVRAMER